MLVVCLVNGLRFHVAAENGLQTEYAGIPVFDEYVFRVVSKNIRLEEAVLTSIGNMNLNFGSDLSRTGAPVMCLLAFSEAKIEFGSPRLNRKQ